MANLTYVKGKPAVDEIVLPEIAQPSTTYQALRSAEIDAMSITLSPELLQEFTQTPGVSVLRGPDYRGWYLYINTQRPPFDRREVRQALAATIDTRALLDTVLLGVGVAGVPGFVHPAVTWADPSLSGSAGRDVARARALLDGSGFRDTGDGVRH